MAVIRGILAVLIGAVVLWVVGALYEYLQPAFIPSPVEYDRIYPWFTGVSALIGATIAVVLFAVWQGKANRTQAKPAHKASTAKASKKPSAASKSGGFKTSSEVPGMPTFDLDEIKKSTKPPAEKKR